MLSLKRQRGQGLVEFALVLPALLMILLAIIEAAIVFQAYLAVQHSAREAARFAVTMEPPQGMMIVKDSATTCGRTDGLCPCDGTTQDLWGFTCSATETSDQWEQRRVRLSQEVATQQAYGLAKELLVYHWNITSENPDPEAYLPDGVKPRFFGVLVRGYYGSQDSDFEYWKPGLEGLPVIVTVYYNVKLLDPLYQVIIPGGQVRVKGESAMINEGITVGLAHLPLPNIEDTPTHEPLTPTPTYTSGVPPTPTDTATPTNTPGPTATPTNTPTPTSTPMVPYIVVSQYEDVHAGEMLTAWLYQHPITPTTTFDLWWYTDTPSGSGRVVTTLLATGISVNAGGVSGPVQFTVPNDTEGTYYLVSFASGTTAPEVGRSALIAVDPLPPDLVVSQISVPNQVDYAGGEPLTVTLEIANLTATGVYNTFFDIDIYVDPSREPTQGFPGYRKQWRTSIGPYGTITATIPITDIVELWSAGNHDVWAQVDTSNLVPDELLETNNISGPVIVDAGCSVLWEDNFNDGSLDAQWTFEDIPSWVWGNATESGGQLTISTNGTSLWGGNNSFSYLYQMVEDDFDARVQVTQRMSGSEDFAKIGLMVRQDSDRDSPYIMIVRIRRQTNSIQWGVRAREGADPLPTGYGSGSTLPVWLRLVRQGSTFDMYYSFDGTTDAESVTNWQLAGSYTVDPETDDFDLNAPLMVGVAAAAYSGTRSGQVDNFWLCLAGAGDLPVPRYGNQSCTQPIQTGLDQPIGGGSFELGWDNYWTHGQEVGASDRDSTYDHSHEIYGLGGAYSMRFKAETFGWNAVTNPGNCNLAQPLHPWLEQSISIPDDADDWVEMPGGSMAPMEVTIYTDFWHQVEPRATPRPDPFLLTVRDVSGGTPITLTNIGTFDSPGEVLISRGDGPTGSWNGFGTDLVAHMTAAGYDIADYAGQDLQLFWFAPNPYDPCDPANIPPSIDAPDLANTWFYLDDVTVEVCTIWPTPAADPNLATVGGRLQVSILGSLQDAPGTMVWAYNVDGDLYITYSIHDSTYHFYNIPPGTYTIYSEAWAGSDLYFASDTVILGPGETAHNLLLK